MSAWHRDNPDLVGTGEDPCMERESYRRALGIVESMPGPDVDAGVEREETP